MQHVWHKEESHHTLIIQKEMRSVSVSTGLFMTD